ncbi:hypothetical protein LPY66_09185 [Dehalobacter sp. DCM]|uniref:hypothetical protein n=1 Tax=Dehalobacter sp. DCM TaxID=2907827 RepID=UPI00308180BC|nr:hypothetical protein LPY66_09185 [Dehalobacter sp. DCM]
MAKPFPIPVVNAAWERAQGHCECEHEGHGHAGRCNIKLVKPMRGGRNTGAWEAHHIDPEGDPVLENLQIMCMECHKASK